MATYSGRGAGAFGAAGGSITFEWVPSPEVVAKALFEAADYLDNLQPPLELSREVAISDIRERFATHTSPDGTPWVAWSEAYAPDALANNIGGILQRTGELEAAATSPAAFLVTGNAVFYETSALPERWIWHQEGTGDRSGGGSNDGESNSQWVERMRREGRAVDESMLSSGNTLPARPFVGLSFEAELRIVEIFDQWFDGAIALGVSSKGNKFARHAKRGAGGKFVPRG